MQKGTVLNFKQFNKYLIFIRNNWCLLSITIVFIIGFGIGIFSVGQKNGTLNLLNPYMNSYISVRGSLDFLSVFLNSFFASFVFLILIFVFGSSVTGVAVVPLILSVRGLIFGSLVGLIYSEYALKGISFNAVILIPPTVISVIFLIIAAKESLNFSILVIKITLPNSSAQNLSLQFGLFCKKHFLIIIPLVISALIDAWLSTKLFTFFNL